MYFELESSSGGESQSAAYTAPRIPGGTEKGSGSDAPTPGGFLRLSSAEQRAIVSDLRRDERAQGRFIHRCMQDISRRLDQNPRPPSHGDACQLVRTKILLERELLENWLLPEGPQWFPRRTDVFQQIRSLLADNPCLHHPLFEHIGPGMGREELGALLRLLSTHNEIMELEQALLHLCTTGEMELAVRSPSADPQTGPEHPARSGLEAWRLVRMPRTSAFERWAEPWFCKVVREGFLMSASRPGWKFRAYGSLLMKESWSCPHLRYLLRGMESNGLLSRRRTAAISACVQAVDCAANGLLQALFAQQPQLAQAELEEVFHGARLAVSLSRRLLDLGHEMLHGNSDPVADDTP